MVNMVPSYPDPEYLISMHDDLAEAYKSIAKVARMDRENNVNVFLSHDASMDVLFSPTNKDGKRGRQDRFEFVRMDGGIEELKSLKVRNRSILTPLPYPF